MGTVVLPEQVGLLSPEGMSHGNRYGLTVNVSLCDQLPSDATHEQGMGDKALRAQLSPGHGITLAVPHLPRGLTESRSHTDLRKCHEERLKSHEERLYVGSSCDFLKPPMLDGADRHKMVCRSASDSGIGLPARSYLATRFLTKVRPRTCVSDGSV